MKDYVMELEPVSYTHLDMLFSFRRIYTICHCQI